jgi:hypothetical protein
VFEQDIKAQNGRMAYKSKGRILNQEEKPVSGCLGQSSVEAWRTPKLDMETTGKCQDPFETQGITVGRAYQTRWAPKSGRKEQCMARIRGFRVTCVFRLRGIYRAATLFF